MQNMQEINWWVEIAKIAIPSLFTLGIGFWLSRKTENYKKELSKEIEDYKKDISKDLYEFQTKYSLLHQKRAEAIVEIYRLIATIEIKLKNVIIMLNPNEGLTIDEELKNAYLFKLVEEVPSLGETLLNTYLQKQILLDEETCKMIEDVIEPTNMAGKFISFLVLREMGHSEFTDNSQERVLKESNELLTEIIPLTKRKLEEKFRQLLSAEKSSSIRENKN